MSEPTQAEGPPNLRMIATCLDCVYRRVRVPREYILECVKHNTLVGSAEICDDFVEDGYD